MYLLLAWPSFTVTSARSFLPTLPVGPFQSEALVCAQLITTCESPVPCAKPGNVSVLHIKSPAVLMHSVPAQAERFANCKLLSILVPLSASLHRVALQVGNECRPPAPLLPVALDPAQHAP